jgi:hypothetical protein
MIRLLWPINMRYGARALTSSHNDDLHSKLYGYACISISTGYLGGCS